MPEPLPVWDDTLWRSHLRANALGTEHHCGIYVQMINDDRKEAARLYRTDPASARSYAESAIRNNRIVTALAALNPLSNALYQRSEPLEGYTSLVQIPEPARSGIVTLIFAAVRLRLKYLSDTVDFLRQHFGPVHIDQIQNAEGELYPLVNATVRDALSPAPATRSEVDKELASSVKQYYGIDIETADTPQAAHTRSVTIAEAAEATSSSASQPTPTAVITTSIAEGVTAAAGLSAAAAGGASSAVAPLDATIPVTTQTLSRTAAEAVPATVDTPQPQNHSPDSSGFATPESPELSSERAPVPKVSTAGDVLPASRQITQASRNRMYTSTTGPVVYNQQTADAYPLAASEHVSSAYPLNMPEPLSDSPESGGIRRSRTTELDEPGMEEDEHGVKDAFDAAQQGLLTSTNPPILKRRDSNDSSDPGLGTRSITELRTKPTHVRRFDDGDEVLLSRYQRLREVMAA